MRNKSLLIIAVLTLQIILVGSVFAGQEWKEVRGNAFECSIAGLWEVPDSAIGLAIVTPLDPTGKRFSITFDSPPPPIPEIVSHPYKFSSSGHGVIYKIEANLYDFSLRRHVVLNDGTVLKMKVRGLTKFLDCNTRVCTYKLTVVDVNGDVLYCIPKTTKLFRMQPQDPCGGVLPDFPE